MRIILVDDNPFDRELVTRMLQRAFSEADLWSCGSLEEFRAALDKGEPDVVVTDFRLQDTDGLQILATTKERFPHCPVVMFTDSGNEELVVKAMRAGLSDYILKRHLRTLPQVVMRCLEEAQVRKERDQALTELEESERRFRAIANLVSDYAFGFLFDDQNLPRVTWISPSFSRRLGYTLEDFRERNLPLLAIAHPDDSPLLQQAMEKVRKGESATFIHRVLTKTQEVRWVRHFCSPRFDKDGQRVIGGDGAAQDITEQKAAEDALRARMAQLALLNQVAQAVLERHDLASMFHAVLSQIEQHLPVDLAWIAQVEGEILQTLCITQRGVEALAGCLEENARLALQPRTLELLAAGQTVTINETETLTRELCLDSTAHTCSSLVMAPMVLQGKLEGVLFAGRKKPHAFLAEEASFLRSVAEHLALAWRHAKLFESLEMAYRDLQQTQAAMMQQGRLRALGQMASGIAHDINNALSPVSLYASVMLRDPTLPEKHRRAAEVILKAVESASETLRRLKSFYRTAPATSNLEPLDLANLVTQVVELTKPKWSALPQQQGVVIDVVTEVEPNLPPFPAVENELRDALTNLILNAVDALPQGGTVTVRAFSHGAPKAGGYLMLEVKDNGVGMDEKTRSHALEPFFTTKESGTGMGLATVYGVVQRHDGTVEIDSAPGQGTTVRLLLPWRELGPDKAASVTPVTLPPLHILFVDDEPLIRESLRHALEQENHTVVACESGEKGLEAFQDALRTNKKFDVVITDLGMPGMSGRQLAAHLKELSPTTPIILLSGWGMTLQVETEPHVDAVLSKPPNLHVLKATMARLLNLDH
ncbi:MAG: hypothetical protein KatS3mg007_1080 [Thermoanaerobaculum sp.]|nr:MAG: hypothetical protein KatS3mg007_1080 [Thermoanaerobaculum sp.]